MRDGTRRFEGAEIEMTINTGDCVQLKTGGCLMTVNNVADLATTMRIDCVWFNDAGELKSGRFEGRALRRWILDEAVSLTGSSPANGASH